VTRRPSPVTFEVVRKVACALPAVEEGTAWGVPALKLHGRLLACMASNKAAEPNTLVVRIGFDQRDAMIADDPQTYYLKPHYEAYACVLVRLSQISREGLTDLLQAGWRFVDASAPARRPRAKPRKQAGSRRRKKG